MKSVSISTTFPYSFLLYSAPAAKPPDVAMTANGSSTTAPPPGMEFVAKGSLEPPPAEKGFHAAAAGGAGAGAGGPPMAEDAVCVGG